MRPQEILFEAKALEDLFYWAKQNKRMLVKIIELLEAIQKNPTEGIGKPEALKHGLKGYWSRRIDHEHRLVYKIVEAGIIVTSCRFHYE